MTVHVPMVDGPKPSKPTKLEQATSGDGRYGRIDAPEPKPTKIASLAILSGRGELVEIPLLGPAWIQLLPHRERTEVDTEIFLEMEALKIRPGTTDFQLAFSAVQAVRTLARVVRDPDDPTHKTSFGTLEQWQELDEDVIAAAWTTYADTRQRLNPLDNLAITDAELVGITFALQKKSAQLLRCFGVAKLSLYLLTTGSQPASSTTSPSSPGPQLPESTPE